MPQSSRTKRIKRREHYHRKQRERSFPLSCKMASDVLGAAQHASPAGILQADDPLDLKPDLATLRVKCEPHEPLVTCSTTAEDPARATPSPSMSVEVKEEAVDSAASSFSGHGTANVLEREPLQISDPELGVTTSDTDCEESELSDCEESELREGSRKRKKARSHHGSRANFPETAKECLKCAEKDREILRLQKENMTLSSLQETETSLRACTQRMVDAVASFEELGADLKEHIFSLMQRQNVQRATPTSRRVDEVEDGRGRVFEEASAAPRTPTSLPSPARPSTASGSWSTAAAVPTSEQSWPDQPAPVAQSAPPMVNIGPCTVVPAYVYRAIDWTCPKRACKDLLVGVFGREVLATSTLTGGRSNANRPDQAVRPALDHVKLNELLKFVCMKLGVDLDGRPVVTESQLRQICRQKISDEKKMKKRITERHEMVMSTWLNFAPSQSESQSDEGTPM